MLKQFLASTAIVAVMAGTAAVAQSNTDTQQQQQTQMQQPAGQAGAPAAAAGGEVAENREMLGENELLASEFIGMSVYNSTAEDAEEIATIEDVLMSQDGQLASVVLNTGGFFGLGGNDYLLPIDRLEISKRDGEFWITSDVQKAELEGMTVFVAERPSEDAGTQQTAEAPQGGAAQTGAAQTGAAPMTGEAAEEAADANREDMAGQTDNQLATSNDAADTATTGSTTAQQDAATTTAQQDANTTTTTTTTTPMNEQAQSQGTSTTEQASDTEVVVIDEAQYTTQADIEALTAENLMDVNVVGANNEDVGDVSDILLSQDGKIEAMVIEVGGFLGIGAKDVAVAFKDLDIRQNEDGDLVLFTQFTQEKLEGAAEYEEAAYQADPNAVVVNPNE